MKAIIIYGISGSGKTFVAERMAKKCYVHIERDKIRFDPAGLNLGNWKLYNFKTEIEFIVDSIWKYSIINATTNGKRIAISDTLCRIQDRRNLNSLLVDLGYEVSFLRIVKPPKVCIINDLKRGDFSVGENVIRKQYEQLVKHLTHI